MGRISLVEHLSKTLENLNEERRHILLENLNWEEHLAKTIERCCLQNKSSKIFYLVRTIEGETLKVPVVVDATVEVLKQEIAKLSARTD